MDDLRPRTVTHSINGQVVEKTYHVYQISGGQYIETTERATTLDSGYGDSRNLRRVVAYVDADRDKIVSVRNEDGTLDSYSYEYGTFTAGATSGAYTFDTSSGSDERVTTIHGTESSTNGVNGLSTKEVEVRDELGHAYIEEKYILTDAGGFVRVDWTRYDERGGKQIKMMMEMELWMMLYSKRLRS